ncbi:MFS transporter [Tardiphaga sp. 20_F10_N6_6]|uniref:MFS transporter n=1 Tax=Tardiphaga sp. 20_F10_N6_6 TaxID=3240788 RepID=UPI003F8967B3
MTLASSTEMQNTLDERRREHLLAVLSAATFVIFFQAYMVAPILPTLAHEFGVSVEHAGVMIPAYLIPYGISTLAYGIFADRIGIHKVMLLSLVFFAALTLLTATADSVEQLVLWRLLTGIGASGVVPLALALVGRLYPYEKRGRPLGWLFSAMAGGMAFGSPLGALILPSIGWKGLFVATALAGALLVLVLLPLRVVMASAAQSAKIGIRQLLSSYRLLLVTPRSRRTYAYVFLNSTFHAGVFTWLGVFLQQRYNLDTAAIGLALLGYGIPGFLFGSLIGSAADRWGRAPLIPVGLLLGSLAAAILMLDFPVWFAPIIAMILSLGYDMTQPLFGGIVTSFAGKRAAQAMGLNVFMLFVGFGVGSLIFGALLRFGFELAFAIFAAVEAVAALLSVSLFRSEVSTNPSLIQIQRKQL